MAVDIQEILMDIRERLVGVETQLIALTKTSESFNKLENKVTELEACTRATKDKVKRLENHASWLWKTVIGFIVVAVLSLIIKGG